MVDYVHKWTEKAELSQKQLLVWIGLWSGTFCKWKRHYGKVFEHNGWIPRDHWLEDWEKQAIIKFHFDNPLNGYRRLAYMMLDQNVVAVSPASVYRVLHNAGLLNRKNNTQSKKGSGFHQPQKAHEHWHVDIAYLNIAGTFYFITSVLDGYSRAVIHWDIKEKMGQDEVQIILQKAKELYPNEEPRVISDNGPQFIAKDFKEFIRISGMTHVRTSPYYPQSNGKLERFNKTLKSECIRPGCPLTLEDAKRIVSAFVHEYNEVRLHSAIAYVTPKDMLEGRQAGILAERERKLEDARDRRAQARQKQREAIADGKAAEAQNMGYSVDVQPEDRAMLGSNPSAELMSEASQAGVNSAPACLTCF